MRLEYALTVNDPRSVTTAAIQSASTGSSHMTKADVMTALGICQSRGGVGLSLMYAKYKKDRTEADKAIRAIHGFAVDEFPTPVGMNRSNQRRNLLALRVPHARGDEP